MSRMSLNPTCSAEFGEEIELVIMKHCRRTNCSSFVEDANKHRPDDRIPGNFYSASNMRNVYEWIYEGCRKISSFRNHFRLDLVNFSKYD